MKSGVSWGTAASAVLAALVASVADCGSGSGRGATEDSGLSDVTTVDTSSRDSAHDARDAGRTDASRDAALDHHTVTDTSVPHDTSTDAGTSDARETSADAGDAFATDAPPDAPHPTDSASDAPLDPQPTACDAGGIPPVVGGTPSCPDDKNLPGCPCAAADASAACWTGERKGRDHGDCQDGTTTCTSSGGKLTWGTCSGEVLPVTGATGKAACECFSSGLWAIDNLSPCFFTETDSMGNMVTGAISTFTSGATVMCPSTFASAPTQPWSTDTLKVDCAGEWNLCYTLKAGNPMSPQPTDCVIIQVCSQSHYSPAETAVTFPPLPGWLAPPSAAACVAQFQTTGGYGQMSVSGQSDECENISKVFQSVTYCAPDCEQPNPPASCGSCMAGGGGSF